MAVLVCNALSKTFSTTVKPEGFKASVKSLVRPERRLVEAVRGISLTVEEGESVAFLGPNGAGKSTTIKMLTGILLPSSGSARLWDLDPAADRKHLAYRIGSVFGQRSQLWYHLPLTDSFRLLAAIYDLDMAQARLRSAELAERFGLNDFLDVPVRKLSLGQRIRAEIAASLLHRPKLLFLDEPTIGLDVVVKREIRKLLAELNRDEGLTIFLTSHDIGDVEKLCRRAIVINHGAVVVDESIHALKHQGSCRKVIGVKYAEGVDFAGLKAEGLVPVKESGDSARFEVDTRVHALDRIIARLSTLGPLHDLTIEDEPLENLIATIFEARQDAAGKGDHP